jgi:hypothetical protein
MRRLVTSEDETAAALPARPGIRDCALCRAVIAKRNHEATVWLLAASLRAERRCFYCGWCHEEHAPDCEDEAINRHYAAVRLEKQKRLDD